MWSVGIRITPKSTIDSREHEQLEQVGWKFSNSHSDGNTLTAVGEFSTVNDLLSALKFADDVSRDVAPLSFEDTVTVLGHPIPRGLYDLGNSHRYIESPGRLGDMHRTTVGMGKPSPNEEDAAKKPPTPVAAPVTIPEFPDSVWNAMDEGTRSRAAAAMVDNWVTYHTDRQFQSAWNGSHEANLMAHLSEDQRSEAATKFLNEEVAAAQQRTRLAGKAITMAAAIETQFEEWTSLARKVPRLLVLSILITSLFVLAGFYLVDRQRLDGWQMVVLSFVFALTAISPATLLLIGRPLTGLDTWTPDAMFKAGKEEPKKDEPKAGETKAPEKPGEQGEDDAESQPPVADKAKEPV